MAQFAITIIGTLIPDEIPSSNDVNIQLSERGYFVRNVNCWGQISDVRGFYLWCRGFFRCVCCASCMELIADIPIIIECNIAEMLRLQ